MPVIALFVKAELENVTNFKAPEGHHWCLKVKNSAGEEERDNVYVSSEEEVELTGSRGTAHFTIKWDGAKKESSMSIVEIKGQDFTMTNEKQSEFVPIVAFECRGMEPVHWYPEGGYVCESTEGVQFEDVDLTEGEWCEYDGENDLPVSIMNIEHKFAIMK